MPFFLSNAYEIWRGPSGDVLKYEKFEGVQSNGNPCWVPKASEPDENWTRISPDGIAEMYVDSEVRRLRDLQFRQDTYYPCERPELTVAPHAIVSNGELAYVAIPKCASSTLKTILGDLGWKWRKGIGPEKPFTVVRDPVERWISGITQSFHKHRNDVLKRMYKDITPFVQDPWFDIHTAPQSSFLKGFISPTLFKVESLDKLKQWLAERDVLLPELTRKNVSKGDRAKKALYDYLCTALTDAHCDRLRAFYKDDVELYERAT